MLELILVHFQISSRLHYILPPFKIILMLLILYCIVEPTWKQKMNICAHLYI